VLAVAADTEKLEELRAHQPDWLVEDFTQLSAAEICRG